MLLLTHLPVLLYPLCHLLTLPRLNFLHFVPSTLQSAFLPPCLL
jgi:hypothetical protein